MDEHKDLEDILEEIGTGFIKFRKERIEKARRIAEPIIPSIKEDLGDNSLEITVENHGVAGRLIDSNSFSLGYTRFLPDTFGDEPNYDDVLGLAQHEKVELDERFPKTIMKEVMVDRVAADRYGPYALFSFQSRNLALGDFTSPWIYALGSLVNLKPLLAHKSQKEFVEKVLKTNYPHALEDMLNIMNLDLSEVPEDEIMVSRKLGNLTITDQVKKDMEDLFSESISGLSMERKHIEYAVNNPFSPLRENPEKYVSDYEKLENAFVLPTNWWMTKPIKSNLKQSKLTEYF